MLVPVWLVRGIASKGKLLALGAMACNVLGSFFPWLVGPDQAGRDGDAKQ